MVNTAYDSVARYLMIDCVTIHGYLLKDYLQIVDKSILRFYPAKSNELNKLKNYFELIVHDVMK